MEFEAENQGGFSGIWRRLSRFFLPDTYHASDFASMFRHAYGEGGPEFVSSSYSEALVTAHRQKRLILIYLHSSVHDNTDRFCSNVLLNDEVVSYFSDNFVCWGGDVSTPAGYDAASLFEVGDFPYIGVFFINSVGSLTRNSRIPLQRVYENQGAIGAQELLEQIRDHITRASPTVQRIFAERIAREEDIRIRQEQDRRYEEAMAKDLEKIQKAEEEERKRQEAEREMEAKAEAEEVSKRTEEALSLSRQLAKEEEYKQLKEKLAPEPQYGPKDSAHPTTTLRFNFPNGSREQRMFEANAPVKQIFYFAAIALYDANIDTELASLLDFALTITIPRKKTLDLEREGDKTLQELDLYPDGKLFVSLKPKK